MWSFLATYFLCGFLTILSYTFWVDFWQFLHAMHILGGFLKFFRSNAVFWWKSGHFDMHILDGNLKIFSNTFFGKSNHFKIRILGENLKIFKCTFWVEIWQFWDSHFGWKSGSFGIHILGGNLIIFRCTIFGKI